MEKIAKQNLGLINPGEEVIIIPKNEIDSVGGAEGPEEEKNEDAYQGLSNPQRWWKFFFEKDI
jgi:hypothetical protein